MKPGSSLLLDDVSDAGNKNVLFSNITPITGPTLQNKSSKIVVWISKLKTVNNRADNMLYFITECLG